MYTGVVVVNSPIDELDRVMCYWEGILGIISDLGMDVARMGSGKIFPALFRLDFHVILSYRVRNSAKGSLVGAVIGRVLQVVPRMASGCYLNAGAMIGGGLRMPHPTSIVIGKGAFIGRNATIFQNVTIGSGDMEAGVYPVIGDDVTIFANAVIVGAVNIGAGAKIGAGAVVVKDVPAGRTAVGNPARILP